MAALLFGPAQTLHWPQAWVFLTIFAAGAAFMGAFLIRRDPGLLSARLNSRLAQGQPLWDRIFMLGAVAGWCAWLALMALDAKRLHPSQMPVGVEVAGALLVIAGFVAVMPVFAANSFAAPVVRVQNEREQRVIDTGPYAYVRHPMYAAAMLYLVGMPLLLGSWYGLIGTALLAVTIAVRAVFEERELKRELPGYTEYTTRVRWRLIPGVW
ncbi:MAG TPA: isoprenylcysteine carboxylmethyltransferase family protein [Rhizomicrobium sp.]|jgi:protein-S-isoprenylcysteine O-methyltransferase Ste14